MAEETQASVPTEGELSGQGEQLQNENLKEEVTEGEGVEHGEGEGEEREGESILEEGENEGEEEIDGELTEEGEEGEAEDEAKGEAEDEAEEEEEEEGEAEAEAEAEVEEEPAVEEEEQYVEVPVDPTAPLNLTESEEAKRPPHVISPEQLAEVEKVWALYQDYNPAYTDLKNAITIKELVYLMKCLLLMPYTPEQLMELVEYVCKPPDPDGLITYEQFLRIVTLRWRDLPLEDELRQALQVFDPAGTSEVDAAVIKETLTTVGAKLSHRTVEALVREVDVGGQGVISIEDVVSIFVMELQIDAAPPPSADEGEDGGGAPPDAGKPPEDAAGV